MAESSGPESLTVPKLEDLDEFMEQVENSLENTSESLDREDPPEYRVPARPEQMIVSGESRFLVSCYLHDPYQKTLVEKGWLQQLVDELDSYPELAGKHLTLVVRPRFNKAHLDSNGGYPGNSRDEEQNQWKNRFLLTLDWLLPDTSPMVIGYDYDLIYHPRARTFQMCSCQIRYAWKPGHDPNDLERELLELGIIKEVSLPSEPAPELAELSFCGTSERPLLTPVSKNKHTYSVAIKDVSNFPDDFVSCWGSPTYMIPEPVIVRDQEKLEAFREALYAPLVAKKQAHLRAFRLADRDTSTTRLRLVDDKEFEDARNTLKQSNFYSLLYLTGWSGSLSVWVGAKIALVRAALTFFNSDWPPCVGLFAGEMSTEAWGALHQLAQDDQIWNLDQGVFVFDGEEWILKFSGEESKEVTCFELHGCGPAEVSPVIEFALQLMKTAGLEPQVQRLVSWRPPEEL